jgi:hypothetical protein
MEKISFDVLIMDTVKLNVFAYSPLWLYIALNISNLGCGMLLAQGF